MDVWDTQARMLADRVSALSEPYRQNTVSWLESCTQTPLDDLTTGLSGFLLSLHPIVRESFVLHTRWILDEAVARFGRTVPRRRSAGAQGVGSNGLAGRGLSAVR